MRGEWSIGRASTSSAWGEWSIGRASTGSAWGDAPCNFSLLQQPLEVLTDTLAGLFQMRFQHAEFRQVQPAQKNIGKPRRYVLGVERPCQAKPHGLFQLRIELVRFR